MVRTIVTQIPAYMVDLVSMGSMDTAAFALLVSAESIAKLTPTALQTHA
jgi:ABC-type transporter Mla MlaB component